MFNEDVYLTTRQVKAEMVDIAIAEATRHIARPGTILYGKLRPTNYGHIVVAMFDESESCNRIVYDKHFGSVPQDIQKMLRQDALAGCSLWEKDSPSCHVGAAKRYGVHVVCAGPMSEIGSMVAEIVISIIKVQVLVSDAYARAASVANDC